LQNLANCATNLRNFFNSKVGAPAEKKLITLCFIFASLNNRTMKKFAFTLLVLIIACTAYAQDTIYRVDNRKIICKVREIGTSEIKYTKIDNPDGPLYAIAKSDVLKIVYANGTVEILEPGSLSVAPPTAKRHYKRAITTRPFSPLFGYVSVGYQHAIAPNRALTGEVGFIGVQVGDLYQPSTGGYLRVGFRMKRTPEIIMPGMEWGYNLAGFYFEPQLVLSTFSREYTTYTQGSYQAVTRTGQFTSGAFLIGLGRQMIVGDIVTIDLGASVGYAFTDHPNTSNTEFFNFPANYYSHMAGGESFPIAWKFTFAMGILMK
jgi:hypothetical protein